MISQKIVLALLFASAVVLAAVLVMLPVRTPKANAEMTSAGRDWVLLTSDTAPTTTDELITVLDTRDAKMIVYRLQNNKLNPMNYLDYGKAFALARPK